NGQMSPANRRSVPIAVGRRCHAFQDAFSIGRSSRLRQRTAKALAILDIVQTSEIFRVGLPWLDVESDEDRALFAQETARRALPLVQARKRIRFRIPRLACQAWKADLASARDVYSPVGFVGAVLAEA